MPTPQAKTDSVLFAYGELLRNHTERLDTMECKIESLHHDILDGVDLILDEIRAIHRSAPPKSV